MPYATINAERLFYVGRDRGSEMDLIFVHGAGETHRIWGPQARDLDEFNIYVPDLPGHGRSEGEGHNAIEGYRELVLQFMDKLEIKRAIVIGHSMGGAIAQDVALKHPGRLLGLGLVGTGARLRVLPSLLQGIQEDIKATAHQVVRYSYTKGADPEMLRRAEKALLNTRSEVIYGDFVACDQFDVMKELNQIKAPTLIICGEQDQMAPPKYARYLHNHIPNSELVLIEGAGHAVTVENPTAVTAAIREFVEARITPVAG